MKCLVFRSLAVAAFSTLLCAGAALVPGAQAAEPEAPAPAPAPEMPPNTVEFTTFQVDGVTCGSCLVPIRRELKALKGIKDIESGVDLKEVIVSYQPGSVSNAQMLAAIKKAGYEAVVKGGSPPVKS